jgi:hypothetical protein
MWWPTSLFDVGRLHTFLSVCNCIHGESLLVTLRSNSGDDLESFAFYMYIYSPITGILLVLISFPLVSGCYLF